MARFDIGKEQPEVYRAMNGTVLKSRKAALEAGLSKEIVELANVRVSQINGCVACLGVHVPALRKAGMPERTIDLIPAWRDADSPFSPQQRAVLELAEALTLMDRQDERDSIVAKVLEFFTTEQVAALEWAIVLINAYNRISIISGYK